MKKMSLKWKIYIVGLVPFSFYLVSVFFSFIDNYSSYSEAESLKSKMKVIEAASAVVNESQKERGKSAGYLNGGVTLESLNDQRSVNDKKHLAFKKVIKESTFDNQYQKELLAELDKYASLRDQVTSKSIPLGQALKTYTGIIKRFLDIELDVAKSTTFPAIATKLKGFRILEDAKESGGKLRANMTGILAKNTPITDKKFSTIVALKAGVDEGIKSSGLVLDEKSKKYISQFKSSKQWKTVNNTFQIILKNSDEGNYYHDPAQFFATITGALNVLGDLIIYQKDELVKDIEGVQKKSMAALWRASITMACLVIGLFFFVSFMSNSITKKVRSVITSLRTSSEEVFESSESISSTSFQLSEASTEQASSLQETVSSVDEISSMVQRNAESAGHSTSTSKKSKEEAIRGRENIDRMISSIGEISESNQEIMDKVQNNNERITKITSLIAEIGDKTKVINDIVFQTKLLSFNASVEAARAGEHGKGFAVVAEEVGNLASMSGKAALEISEMLESSIKQVNDIVNSSKREVEDLIVQGKEKVEQGRNIAHSCREALENILSNVSSVNEMVQEISVASEEQAAGIREITGAMQKLDHVTHKNTSVAQSSAAMASQLKASAQNMNQSVRELAVLIDGSSEVGKLVSKKVEGNNASVIPLQRKESIAEKAKKPSFQVGKVSGSDLSIPSDDDPRFEDL